MDCLSVEDMYDINYSLILVCTNEYWKFSITETFFLVMAFPLQLSYTQ